MQICGFSGGNQNFIRCQRSAILVVIVSVVAVGIILGLHFFTKIPPGIVFGVPAGTSSLILIPTIIWAVITDLRNRKNTQAKAEQIADEKPEDFIAFGPQFEEVVDVDDERGKDPSVCEPPIAKVGTDDGQETPIGCLQVAPSMPVKVDLLEEQMMRISLEINTRIGLFEQDQEFPQFAVSTIYTSDVLAEEFCNLYDMRLSAWRDLSYFVTILQSYSRYPDILPAFRYNAVSETYNASVVQLSSGFHLASQAPRVDDEDLQKFYQILKEFKVTHIVRLTRTHDIHGEKCADYWTKFRKPTNPACQLPYLLLDEADQEFKISLIEDLECWPDDRGIDPVQLLEVVAKVRDILRQDSKSRLLVHCSAGVGRTGTFLAALEIVNAIDEQKPFSIKQIVFRLSLQRAHSVMTPQQYETLYELARIYQEQTCAHPITFVPQSEPAVMSSAKQLITSFRSNMPDLQRDPNLLFDKQKFVERLEIHCKRFEKAGIDTRFHQGFVEKFDLSPDSIIFVRGDLHGDLTSLLMNLETIKEQGLLDDEYRCKPNVHIVLLGDFVNRDPWSVYIIEIITLLREENPGRVHLIKGNHDNVDVSLVPGMVGLQDPLTEIIFDSRAREKLEQFYQTLPLAVMVGSSEQTQVDKEFILFTHGLFSPTHDLTPLTSTKEQAAYMLVPKSINLSSRLSVIASSGEKHPLWNLAKRINEIAKMRIMRRPTSDSREIKASEYNCADLSSCEDSFFGSLVDHFYALSQADIKTWSVLNRVGIIIRAHEHSFTQVMSPGSNSVMLYSLSVGAFASYVKPGFTESQFSMHHDTSFIIHLNADIRKSVKRVVDIKRTDRQTTISTVSPIDAPISF